MSTDAEKVINDYRDMQDEPVSPTDPNPSLKRTISYAWPDSQYRIIAALAKRENRKMRNMLFHIVEFYIKANKLDIK